MINEKIERAFNKQLNEEAKSAYIYLSMAAYFESINLKGFAHWMTVQAQEEVKHAMKFYSHILERGGKVRLEQIDKPSQEWSSPLAAFETAYKHECYITDCINGLVKTAREANDHPAEIFLNWFVEEQVEEEASADEVVQKLKMTKDSTNGLLMLDKELAARKE